MTPKFSIKDRVSIKEIMIKGTIKSIWITEKGIKYEVRYFDKAEPQEVYFYEEELSTV